MTDGMIHAAVDTGGTFTDVVLWTGTALVAAKVGSTPEDPSRALLAGLQQAAAAAGLELPVPLLVHGSTVATNALLEGRVAAVALVTNRGLEDVLAIGRQARPQLYALHGERPPPLVPERLRFGIGGRVAADGAVLEDVPEADVDDVVSRILASGAESVAVVLLHSYAHPGHEARVAAGVRSAGLPCSVSSELLPEHREYERMTTTVVNAAVAPVMSGYLGRIGGSGAARRVRIMGSSGGALTVERAAEAAAHTILSGPAGGVAGAMHVARRHGIADIMTFDMGGTSTDVSLCPGRPLYTRDFAVAGTPVALPVLDIHTVGAGGGSIARVDSGGALRVGPASAGAVPGPVCYGRGGSAVTVTDANAALGRLVGGDGALSIDASLVAGPLQRLARELGTDPGEAAEGVVAVVNTAMEGALRVISVERGHDAAAFTLVPFGGAAGLHAVSLAERLEIRQLLVPPAPGVLSAFGMLVAPLRRDAARSVLLTDPEEATLAAHFRELDALAMAAVADEVEESDVALHRTVAARYRGQSHELEVAAAGWRDAFHAAHRQRFGYSLADGAVEAVTLRVEAVGPEAPIPPVALPAATGPATPCGSGDVRVDGAVVRTPRFLRESLRPGHRVNGPALLLESTATFWLPPAWQAEVLGDGSLLVQPAG
jgi:N-methylhydantoinase A